MKHAFNSQDSLQLTGLAEHMTILATMHLRHVKDGAFFKKKKKKIRKSGGGTC
jgi:hypothetical protein